MELKDAATIREQVRAVSRKGFIVGDEDAASRVLSRVGYYRFSAYFETFREGSGYVSGVPFERVVRIYESDSVVRAWIFSIIDDVECYVRGQVSNYIALTYGPGGYLNADMFDQVRHHHAGFLANIYRIIEENRESTAVKHHMANYDGRFPIWAMVELMPLRDLVDMYVEMLAEDREKIAWAAFGASAAQVESWLLVLVKLRRKCVRFNRLYGVEFEAVPADIDGVAWTMDSTLFSQILMLKQLHADERVWGFALEAFEEILEDYAGDLDLRVHGFPENWVELLG